MGADATGMVQPGCVGVQAVGAQPQNQASNQVDGAQQHRGHSKLRGLGGRDPAIGCRVVVRRRWTAHADG